MEIKTWADFSALSEEDRAAFTPEELETLKNSITAHEAELAKDYKKKEEDLDKFKTLSENYKIRAEKAEGKVKDEQSPSLADIRALNDVHDEDVQEIIDYAAFKKIGVAEAKKSTIIKNYLQTRNEERETAKAASVKGGGMVTTDTPEKLLSQVRNNPSQFSEKDEDIDALIEARHKEKFNK